MSALVPPPRRAAREAGYVLPFVLVVVAALSVLTFGVNERIRGAAGAVLSEDQLLSDERTLLSAAEAATFDFVTGQTVEAGIHTGAPLATDPFGAVEDPEAMDPDDVWRPDGEARPVPTPSGAASVAYLDASAHAPFALVAESHGEALLALLGADRQAAPKLSARVRDFTDSDQERRFLGAERADYPRGALGPTDSPLRSPAELSNVLGAGDDLPADVAERLARIATFAPGAPSLRTAYAPPALRGLLPGERDDIAVLLADGATPSGHARFVLTAPGGLTRAIDVERTAVSARAPFARGVAFEGPLLSGEAP